MIFRIFFFSHVKGVHPLLEREGKIEGLRGGGSKYRRAVQSSFRL